MRSFINLYLFVTLTMLLIIPIKADAELVASSRWKVRALEAEDRLTSLHVTLRSTPKNEWKSKETAKLECKVMLESAYGRHLTEESNVYKAVKSTEYFHLLLSSGRGAEFLDLVYAYNPRIGLIGARIDTLPEGWSLLFPSSRTVIVNLPGKESCRFSFDLRDPFNSKVVSN
jgi:hypothetical protein